MTRKLESLFDLPSSVETPTESDTPTIEETRTQLAAIDSTIDKIDAALPAVRGLDASDTEMDDLAQLAQDSYKDLMDLGMQVDSRFASEIFSVASNMLGHAITAKTAKLNKKLRMIDLQMKKIKLDRDVPDEQKSMQTAEGMVLNRNDLLERLLKGKDQNATKDSIYSIGSVYVNNNYGHPFDSIPINRFYIHSYLYSSKQTDIK
jgi:hypothetical protein